MRAPEATVDQRADFSRVRYAQCWEDADVLLAAAAPLRDASCLSIASAGDNSLALLSGESREVVALDLNPAQLACLALRVAAYRTLSHGELLEFVGSRPSSDRLEFYRRCRRALAPEDRAFWDQHGAEIARGIGAIGRFERYFELFRRRVLPLVHDTDTIAELTRARSSAERDRFYRDSWNNLRWRLLFRLFFSRFVMGRSGRDPELFRYVEGSVASRILARTKHALTALDPAENPYLCWILYGDHRHALPLALRPQHFDCIRDNLDRLQWHRSSLTDYLAAAPAAGFDLFNLSDVFEYMSEAEYARQLDTLLAAASPGARLVYWNLLAPRSRPLTLAARLSPKTELAQTLHQRDKAFFYSRLIVEEVTT